MNIKTKPFFAIAVISIISLGLVIFFTYLRFYGEGTTYEPQAVGVSANTEKKVEDARDGWPEIKPFDQVLEKTTLDELESGTYENVEILVLNDSYIDGELVLRNVILNLNNRNLYIQPNSSLVLDQVDVERGGINLDAASMKASSSIFRDISRIGILAQNKSNVQVLNSQFFDVDHSGVYVTDPQSLSLEKNDFVDVGCFLGAKEGKSQLCLRDNLEYSAVDVRESMTENLSIKENSVAGRINVGDSSYVDIVGNKFLGYSSLFVWGGVVAGNIKENSSAQSGMDLDILNASALNIEANSFEYILCKSSARAEHNWSDVMGVNYISGKNLIGKCSKYQ